MIAKDRPEDGSTSRQNLEVDIYFIADEPFFEEFGGSDPSDELQTDKWQTVKIWPLHFYVSEMNYLSVHFAQNVHTGSFAFLQAAEDHFEVVMERFFAWVQSEGNFRYTRREGELYDCISDLLDTAEARIENERLNPGAIIRFS